MMFDYNIIIMCLYVSDCVFVCVHVFVCVCVCVCMFVHVCVLVCTSVSDPSTYLFHCTCMYAYFTTYHSYGMLPQIELSVLWHIATVCNIFSVETFLYSWLHLVMEFLTYM